MILEELDPEQAALLVIDIQEKLYPKMDHPCEFLENGLKMIKGAQLFNLPILLSEQNPKGLGRTLGLIQTLVPDQKNYFAKTSFSSIKHPSLLQAIEQSNREQWILIGIEAHVCVLQTAKDLLKHGYEVTVVNDAISSRSIIDFSTAIAELRDMGVRISSVETILFELLKDATHPQFKACLELVKNS